MDIGLEIWKDIIGYEGIYQHNLEGVRRVDTGRVLKLQLDRKGYYFINLYKNGKGKSLRFHRIIAESFVPNPENKPYINHKNLIKTDNHPENLEWCTCRENLIHYCLSKQSSSKYTGVKFSKKYNKWVAQIRYNGKSIYLGSFDIETDASLSYQKALKEIQDGIFTSPIYTFSSKYKGVHWCKIRERWVAQIRINGKRKFIGYFDTETKASRAYKKYRDNIILQAA